MAMAVVVMMAMSMAMLQHGCRRRRVEHEVSVDGLAAAEAHEEPSKKQHARHAQGSQALHLAESHGELLGRRAQAPGDGGQCKHVGGKIGQTVPRVGDHGLRVEGVAAGAFGDGHAQVGVEADARDAHTGVVFVLRGEVDIIMVVVMVVVRMAGVAPCLGSRAHDVDG